MAAVPEVVQVLFGDQDDQANSEGTSEASTTSSQSVRDYHREQFPAYQPPHMRGHNTQQDKFINFKNRDPRKGPDPDKVEGVDNDKYQRLKLPVPFALDRGKLAKLKSDFPGVYFHVRDNGNHDHQFSHVVTMIGTRFLQRRIKAGARVLDAYGNANASDRFNTTQVNAANPKSMKSLCLRVGPTDFIREVNKWGPYMDEAGDQRYFRGTLKDMVNDETIREFDVLQFIHTLYYQDFGELTEALHAPCDRANKRVAYALIHRHEGSKGSINDGEQTYVKKTTFSGLQLIKQVNVKTKSEYVHKDLTPLLFRADKTWFPHADAKHGITWECHMVNDETWVIEIVPYTLHEMRDDVVDYGALWDMDDDLTTEFSGVETPPSSKSGVTFSDNCLTIPTDAGEVRVEIVNQKLFSVLRQACAGKERNAKLMDEVISLAKHHVSPSSMFGDKEGMRCAPEKVFDHAIAAYFVDLDHETRVTEAASTLRPVLSAHTSGLKLGPKYRDYTINDLLSLLRCAVTVGRSVNTVIRAKDPIDRGLEILGNSIA